MLLPQLNNWVRMLIAYKTARSIGVWLLSRRSRGTEDCGGSGRGGLHLFLRPPKRTREPVQVPKTDVLR